MSEQYTFLPSFAEVHRTGSQLFDLPIVNGIRISQLYKTEDDATVNYTVSLVPPKVVIKDGMAPIALPPRDFSVMLAANVDRFHLKTQLGTPSFVDILGIVSPFCVVDGTLIYVQGRLIGTAGVNLRQDVSNVEVKLSTADFERVSSINVSALFGKLERSLGFQYLLEDGFVSTSALYSSNCANTQMQFGLINASKITAVSRVQRQIGDVFVGAQLRVSSQLESDTTIGLAYQHKEINVACTAATNGCFSALVSNRFDTDLTFSCTARLDFPKADYSYGLSVEWNAFD